MKTCGLRRSAMDIDGWGYVECDRPAGHPLHPDRIGGGHHFGPITHDGGAHRAAQLSGAK